MSYASSVVRWRAIACGGIGASIALVAACGTLIEDQPVDSVDASTDQQQQPQQDATSGGGDGGGAADGDGGPRCNPTAPFAEPVPVEGVKGPIFGAWFTPSEDAIYYSDGQVIFFAERTGPNAFAMPIQIVVVGNGMGITNTSRPSLSSDRMTLYFESGFDVWRATSTSALGPFTTINRVLDGAAQPIFDEAHGAFYISRNVAQPYLREILRASVSDAGTIGSFAPVFDSDASTHNAVPGVDGNTLYFAAVNAPNGDDVHRVVGDLKKGLIGFGSTTTMVVPNVNTIVSDEPEWLSPDGCHLYLSSRRNSSFDAKLYLAARGL